MNLNATKLLALILAAVGLAANPQQFWIVKESAGLPTQSTTISVDSGSIPTQFTVAGSFMILPNNPSVKLIMGVGYKNNQDAEVTDFFRIFYDDSKPKNETLVIAMMNTPSRNFSVQTYSLEIPKNTWLRIAFSVDFARNLGWFDIKDFENSKRIGTDFPLSFGKALFNKQIFVALGSVPPLQMLKLSSEQVAAKNAYAGDVKYLFYSFSFFSRPLLLDLCYSPDSLRSFQLSPANLPIKRTQADMPKTLNFEQRATQFLKLLFDFRITIDPQATPNEMTVFRAIDGGSQNLLEFRLVRSDVSPDFKIKLLFGNLADSIATFPDPLVPVGARRILVSLGWVTYDSLFIGLYVDGKQQNATLSITQPAAGPRQAIFNTDPAITLSSFRILENSEGLNFLSLISAGLISETRPSRNCRLWTGVSQEQCLICNDNLFQLGDQCVPSCPENTTPELDQCVLQKTDSNTQFGAFQNPYTVSQTSPTRYLVKFTNFPASTASDCSKLVLPKVDGMTPNKDYTYKATVDYIAKTCTFDFNFVNQGLYNVKFENMAGTAIASTPVTPEIVTANQTTSVQPVSTQVTYPTPTTASPIVTVITGTYTNNNGVSSTQQTVYTIGDNNTATPTNQTTGDTTSQNPATTPTNNQTGPTTTTTTDPTTTTTSSPTTTTTTTADPTPTNTTTYVDQSWTGGNYPPTGYKQSVIAYPDHWQRPYRDDRATGHLFRLANAAFAFFIIGMFLGIIGLLVRCRLCQYDPFFYHKFVQTFQIYYYVAFWALYNSLMAQNVNAYLRRLLHLGTGWHQTFNGAATRNRDVNSSLTNDITYMGWWGFRENSFTNYFVLNFGLIFLIQLFVVAVYLIAKIISLIMSRSATPVQAPWSRWVCCFPNVITNMGSKSCIYLLECKALLTVFIIFIIETTVFVFYNFVKANHQTAFGRFSVAWSVVYLLLMVVLLCLVFHVGYSYPLPGSCFYPRFYYLVEGLRPDLISRLFHGIQYLHYFLFAIFISLFFRVRLLQAIPIFIFMLALFAYSIYGYAANPWDRYEQIWVHFLLFFAQLFMFILVVDDTSHICSPYSRWAFGFIVCIVTFILILWNTLWLAFKLFSYFYNCWAVQGHCGGASRVGPAVGVPVAGAYAGGLAGRQPETITTGGVSPKLRKDEPEEVGFLENQGFNPDQDYENMNYFYPSAVNGTEVPTAQPRYAAPQRVQANTAALTPDMMDSQAQRPTDSFDQIRANHSNDIQFKSNLDHLRNIGAKKNLGPANPPFAPDEGDLPYRPPPGASPRPSNATSGTQQKQQKSFSGLRV